jgi:type I restriction enzyme, S subunit
MRDAPPKGWEVKRLDQLGLVGRGRSRHRPRNDPALYGGEYAFFQTGDVKAADLNLTEFAQTYNEAGLAQSKLWEPGTLCITIAANIAETAILGVAGCFPDSVVGFVADPAKSDPRFTKYYIDTIKLRMQSVSKGTTQDNLSLDKLLSFEFVVPDVDVQRRIADAISAYDELIENNKRRIAILEEMARAIYREWFVHFRFPGHEQLETVDSQLGPVPVGWRYASMLENPYFEFISESVRMFVGEKTYLATADVDGIDIVNPGEEISFGNRPSRAQKEPVPNSIWFARMKDTYKVLGFSTRRTALAERIVLSSGFAGFWAREPWGFPYLFFTVDSTEFHQVKDLYCTGATQQSLTNSGMESIAVVVPPEALVKRFGEMVEPINDHIFALQAQVKNLRQTRDLLLPKLISGEIDVWAADDALPGAAA